MSANPSLSTLERRLRRAQTAMVAAGLDGLLLTSTRNIAYFTGLTPDQSLARPWFLLVSMQVRPVLLVARNKFLPASRRSVVAEVRSYSTMTEPPITEITATLGDLALQRGRLGAELGREQRLGISLEAYEIIEQALGPSSLVDASDLLWRVRAIKGPEDVACLREAHRITAAAYGNTFAALRLGESEASVARRMRLEMTALGGAEPWVAITSGPGNYDFSGSAGTERTITEGDMVWLDAGCSVGGFFTDYSRAAVMGKPSSEQEAAQRLAHEITSEAIKLIAPGTAVSDVAAYCQRRLESLGLSITSNLTLAAGRVGHGIGLDVTEPPHVAEYDQTILEPGMVIAIEPGFSTQNGIFHVEENVYVTDDGCEVLSRFPWHLTIAGSTQSSADHRVPKS